VLDIVMVAHKPNYKRMAHRSLSSKGDPIVEGALPSAIDLVPVAGKVILSIEGGKQQDFEAAEAYLSSQNLEWQIVHNDVVTTYRETMMRALEECTAPLVAIIPGWCEVSDPMWVQRMMWPLQRDQQALLCTTGEEQGAAKDLAPFVALPRKWPGGELILARRAPLLAILRLSTGEDFHQSLALSAASNGWRIWSHPGIRFQNLEHDNHEARKTSGRQARKTAASSDS
jgi:hypothetical protein